MQSPNTSPMIERKTIVAFILCLGIFYGWNKYMNYKYPNMGKPAATASSDSAVPLTGAAGGTLAASGATPAAGTSPATLTAPTPSAAPAEQLLNFTSSTVNFAVSSVGMGLKNVVLSAYTDHENVPISLGRSSDFNLFEFRIGNAPIHFNVTKSGDNSFTGDAMVGSMQIHREITFEPATYSFKSKTHISKANDEVLRGIRFLIPEAITAKASTSFLFPSYEHQDLFVEHDTKNDVVNFSASKENLNKQYTSAGVVSLSSQYFATAVVDKSDISPELTLTSRVAEKTALAEMVYKPAALKESYQLDQTYYVGPKSIDILSQVDPELPMIINFGWFGIIARPLLYIMKAFHSVVGNWGLAIIFLTLLVRLVVLPFNLMSFKSMKAMQKIQPLMTEVRARYKDDPVRMNQEVMALMKQHNANPLGGCLPMLLQIPVFFALYRVIGSSIELYKSPFFGWIGDLSGHDPFYVLPVLMGATMFAQQKLTPTNMDPAQAKIMAFLPLVFSAFMLQLPSGLTLYMFVSGLFGITQQWFMLKKKA